MSKLVLIVLSVMLFVSCEHKKSDIRSPEMAPIVMEEIKNSSMGLTFSKPSDVAFDEDDSSCVFAASGYRMKMIAGAGFAKPTLTDALLDKSTQHWIDVKGEEIKNGYYLTYVFGDVKKVYNVMARLEINNKTYFLTGTAENSKGQTVLANIIKSIE